MSGFWLEPTSWFIAAHPCVLTWWKEQGMEGYSWGLFYKGPIPIHESSTLISPKPYLLILSHWGAGFNIWIWGVHKHSVCWSPQICSQLGKKKQLWVDWELHLQPSPKVIQVLQDQILNLWGSALTLGSVRIELNCWTQSWCGRIEEWNGKMTQYVSKRKRHQRKSLDIHSVRYTDFNWYKNYKPQIGEN